LPKLTEKKYARKILYDIFIEFKNMLLLSMIKNKDTNINKKGIDFDTFFNCNIKINHQGKIIAKKLFEVFNKKSGIKYMKIDNYINAMIKMKDSNKENKLDLFFKMLDSNSDGYLTYDEIYKLSIICLQKITLNFEEEFEEFGKIQKQNNINQDMQIVEVLADYFCKMIFKLVKININEKIPLKTLKEMIMKGGEEADYIELLFGSSNFV
jgi:Ca2+-binding EF-hand superfamily protein